MTNALTVIHNAVEKILSPVEVANPCIVAIFTVLSSRLPAAILRHPAGFLCGYVGVYRDHAWFGRGYHDGEPPPVLAITVHGGISYAEPYLLFRREIEDASVWWFGFDCMHAGDDYEPGLALGRGTYRDEAYVAEEIFNMAEQLERYRVAPALPSLVAVLKD